MSRHVLVGRYGPGDSPAIKDSGGNVTELDLLSADRTLRFGLGEAIACLKDLGITPSQIGVDLAVVSAMVQAADTRISRVEESQDSWTREIRLVIPVAQPDRWDPASELLERLLHFLTGDQWEIGFRQCPADAQETLSKPDEAPASFDDPCLFSGGLDSLIGAIDLLESGKTPLFVSHAGEGSTSKAQADCFAAIRSHYDDRILHRLRVWMSFPKSLIEGVGAEDSTRGRSFLFIALGVLAGTGLGRKFVLGIPENGFIALNVPSDVLRLGSHSTRTTHPFYLARWNELLAVIGIDATVENPYWDRTKGEMVADCANSALITQLIPNSLSCSSPTKSRWKGSGVEHCGYCLPCLIRRAAIERGIGKGSDRTRYTIPDLSQNLLDTRKAEGQQVRSLQISLNRLKSRSDLGRLLIHKPGPLSDVSGDLDALAGVYTRGMEEIASLLTNVVAKPQ